MKVQSKLNATRSSILEGTAGTMKSLTKAQEASGKAHIVVQVMTKNFFFMSRIFFSIAGYCCFQLGRSECFCSYFVFHCGENGTQQEEEK